MVSRHLGKQDILPAPQKAMGTAADLSADTLVAVDCSDLGKAFGGMVGMEWGRDRSAGRNGMGHLFVCAAVVPGAGGVARLFRKSCGPSRAMAVAARPPGNKKPPCSD